MDRYMKPLPVFKGWWKVRRERGLKGVEGSAISQTQQNSADYQSS